MQDDYLGDLYSSQARDDCSFGGDGKKYTDLRYNLEIVSTEFGDLGMRGSGDKDYCHISGHHALEEEQIWMGVYTMNLRGL